MNNQTVYWLWIQQQIGYASNKISSILSKYTFAEDFYRASLEDKLSCGCFKPADKSRLLELSLDTASAVMTLCKKRNINIITIGDADYPERLRQIPSPPVALYIKGNTHVLSDDLSIAIVGTRNATPYGRNNAFDFGYNLAKNGVTVVSGGALGIDTASHQGALQAGGKTVCVLGCGIDYGYLRENEPMRNEIAHYGAVVSEYPPDYPASRFTFPQRNRIISGLARGVLVVEAGMRSGSLITANIALEQNRDVFAIPGNIRSDVSFGTNRLIKDGAKPVTEVADILEEYIGINNDVYFEETQDILTPFNYNVEENLRGKRSKNSSKRDSKTSTVEEEKEINTKTIKQAEIDKNTEKTLPQMTDEDFSDLSKNARKILTLFDENEIHIDTITEKSGLSVGAVHSAMTELEMNDLIESLQGRMYKRLVVLPL